MRQTYYKGQWEVWDDGGSGTWLYAKKVDSMTWIFIEIDDMVDSCGRDATELFYAAVKVVDLAQIPTDTMAKASQCCGHDGAVSLEEMAYSCQAYGAYAPMYSESSGAVTEENRWGNAAEAHPAFRSLRKRAREAAEELFDDEVREAALNDRVVNKLGSTARQFMHGDLWGRLREIRDDPDATEDQKLMLKMYANAGITLGGEPVPKDLKEMGDGNTIGEDEELST